MTSDQVIWSEQNRLHIAYKKAKGVNTTSQAGADAEIELDFATALPDVAAASRTGAIRIGQTVLLSDEATGLVVQKALVQNVGTVNAANGTNDKLFI
jgi:hypothetical protein